jgi:hypothetical protein
VTPSIEISVTAEINERLGFKYLKARKSEKGSFMNSPSNKALSLSNVDKKATIYKDPLKGLAEQISKRMEVKRQFQGPG